MPWTAGSFSRTDGTRTGTGVWTAAKAAGVKIITADHDTHDQDLADGINATLLKDGSNTPTANLAMGNFKHTGVGNASARTEYPSAGQVQDSAFLWGGTAGGTADALTITLSPAITAYAAGQRFAFIAAAANTGAATIDVNGVGTKTIQLAGSALAAGDITSGRLYEIVYDGTQFQVTSPYNEALTQLSQALDANDQLVSKPILKDYAEEVDTEGTSGSTYTIDITNGNVHDVTLSANCTFTFSNPIASGDSTAFTLILRQDGTGSRTATWPASVDWPGATAPTLSTGAADVDVFAFMTVDGGTTWLGFTAGQDLS